MLDAIFKQPWPDVFPVRLKRYFETFWMMRKWGMFKSMVRGGCVDAEGKPIPWWSYPAIHFFQHRLNLRDLRVFEWGSGASTLFFYRKGAIIKSVEGNPLWFDWISRQIFHAQERDGDIVDRLKVVPRWGIEDYVDEINLDDTIYDIIVIDGKIHHALDKSRAVRHECALQALGHKHKSTIIVLDNADWLPATRRTLRKFGLIEIPFIGHAPLVPYVTTTSLFLGSLSAIQDYGDDYCEPIPGSLERNYEANIYPTYKGWEETSS